MTLFPVPSTRRRVQSLASPRWIPLPELNGSTSRRLPCLIKTLLRVKRSPSRALMLSTL
ncbi:hypothetical protein DPMN_022810 [Dreissena polymorpha]|uniref:Uncharacterized protein n=1 Tax=Dreissena polymorpha TaxID=45954 RepID=A0A9D4SBZ0_DREPO|nr:hypothetical protein DPMN_022810 [Dreissena polymorpha]